MFACVRAFVGAIVICNTFQMLISCGMCCLLMVRSFVVLLECFSFVFFVCVGCCLGGVIVGVIYWFSFVVLIILLFVCV